MTKCVELSAKTYSYLIDDGSEDKKAKGTKKCVRKRKLEFENYRLSRNKITLVVSFTREENIKNS